MWTERDQQRLESDDDGTPLPGTFLYAKLHPMETNKNAFFKLLRKSAPPSEQPAKKTKGKAKRAGYSAKKIHPDKPGGKKAK